MRLEKSYITPIHKKDDNQDPKNYCMESIIKDHLLKYLKDNNILSNKQHGSLPRRSSLVITKRFRPVD